MAARTLGWAAAVGAGALAALLLGLRWFSGADLPEDAGAAPVPAAPPAEAPAAPRPAASGPAPARRPAASAEVPAPAEIDLGALVAEHARRDTPRWKRLAERLDGAHDPKAAAEARAMAERVAAADGLARAGLARLARDELALLRKVGKRRPGTASQLRELLADAAQRLADALEEGDTGG